MNFNLGGTAVAGTDYTGVGSSVNIPAGQTNVLVRIRPINNNVTDPSRSVSLTVTWVADLPSKGDTCFPALMPRQDGTFRIYNYTSPLEGPDLSWIEGQLGPTVIVSTDLSFVPAGSRSVTGTDGSATAP